MDPLQEGDPTAKTVYVLDLVGYRGGEPKLTSLGEIWWHTDEPAGDPVLGGQWWRYPFSPSLTVHWTGRVAWKRCPGGRPVSVGWECGARE
jgi:hypothetical protein